MSLQDTRIVILGGTSGLGFATAQAAAREGARVVIASSSRERVDRAVAALPARTEGFVVDVSREDDIARFFATVGPFDHLVFTAGESLTLSPLSTMRLDTAREAFTRRYWGALSAVKYGREGIRPGGSIVLTTGAAKDRPHAGWTVAASICGAIDALTRALAVELARRSASTPCRRASCGRRCGTTWRRATVRRSIARSATRYRSAASARHPTSRKPISLSDA
jgi:NAD(P)-dependent dehydrogenase (short-subunit alcohol dehydrogenase family)